MSLHLSGAAVLLAIIAFLISRGVGGVVGEYAKRFWFSRLEPFLAAVAANPIQKGAAFFDFLRGLFRARRHAEIEALKFELARLESLLERALQRNDELVLKIIQTEVGLQSGQTRQASVVAAETEFGSFLQSGPASTESVSAD